MFRGVLRKMITEKEVPIRYFLDLEDDFLVMNRFLGRNLKITYDGSHCLNCNQSKHIVRQCFCKQGFFDIPSAVAWVMRPELSNAALGLEDLD